jgi:hypothetical protein
VIREIAREVETRMRAQGFPFRVVYGPERTQGDATLERIVLDETEETFAPTRSQHRNPRSPMTNVIGCVLRVYARAPDAGARIFEHRRRARQVLDGALAALDVIIRGTRRNGWLPTGGAFVKPADLAEAEQWSGAVYELRFAVERAVLALTWAGEARPTAELELITSTTQASLATLDEAAANDPPDEAETACGA